MKKNTHVKVWIKVTAYLMAVSIILGQSMVGKATENQSQTSEKDTLTSKENVTMESAVVLDENSTEDNAASPEETGESVDSAETAAEEIPAQIEELETAQESLLEITEQKSVLALVYLCDKYEVKDSPSKDGSTVVSVVSGQSVQIEGVDLDEEGNVWYKVSFYQQDESYTGYIEKQYLATSDEDFLGWTDEYVEEEEIPANKPMTMSLPIMTLSDYPDVNQFPASYQNSLLALKQKYPNWIFVKMETGLNFNTAVSNELGDKSWISSTKPASWQNGAAAQSGWSYASEGILRYYMDPRNFLTESAIFQFEQLTYNESYHTETAVQAIVASSFMAGEIPNENMTYAQAFTKIGEELKISPFHLASRVLQEQGTKGTSPLISDTYSGYEGYYNYFNVGASGKDIELIVKGLTEAMNRGWNTRYKSLYGGASVIGQNYILRGQDTLYLQKFNVSSNSTYNHQYMQNIQAPASEAPSIQKAYSNTGSLNNSFVFKIPVYSNMPASACAQPDTTDKITLSKSTISDLAVDKTEKLVPYVNGSKPDNVNDMTFTSSNTSVATVDAQGVIKAVSPGTTTITCARSGAASATCTVTVVKAEPVVDTPVLPPVVYKDGLKLSDISLPEGWAWSDGNTRLNAGTDSYSAVYTPADTTRYLTVTRQIGIKVSQAIPSCTVPENLAAKLGSKLGSIALPDGFIWESDAETILDKAGEQTYYLSYYPSDQNYFELLHIPVIVKVIDDQTEPEEPDDQDGLLPGGDIGSGNSNNGNGNSNNGSGNSGNGNGNIGSSNGNSGSSGTSGSGSGSNTGNGDLSTGSGNSDNPGGSDNDSSSSSSDNGSDSSSFDNGSDSSSSGNNGGQNNDGTTSSGSTSDSGNTDNSGSTGSDSPNSGGQNSDSTTSSGSTSDSGNTGNSGSNSSDSSNSSGPTSSDGQNSAGSNSSNSQNNNTVSTGGGNDNSNTGSSTSVNSSSANTNGDNAGSGAPVDSGIINTNNGNTSNSNATTDNSGGNINSGSTTGDNNGGNTNNSSTTANNNSTIPSSNTTINNDSTPTQNKGCEDIPTGSNQGMQLAMSDSAAEESEEKPAYARPSVTVEMEDVSILTDEMLQMAKDQNVDLILKMNNKAMWHVNAGTVKGSCSDIDMNVLFEQGVVPQDLLEQFGEETGYQEFTLAHDGPFGFGAELEIMLNPEYCGRYANLFYYDSGADTLEFICADIIDENGYARFSMEHASSYVIIISDHLLTEIPGENGTSSSPIRWLVVGILILLAFAATGTAGYFYLQKRREEEEDDDEEDEEDIEEDVIEEETVELPVVKVVAKQMDNPVQIEEDDWIEDEDWQEPEKAEEDDPYAADHAEDDWIEDDEWDISNDWMEDEEWEKRSNIKKTAV